MRALIASFFLASAFALGEPPDLEKRFERLEERLSKVETELEGLREMGNLDYSNVFYFNSGLILLFPRPTGFVSTTDTGLGFFLGAGKYFGEHNVAELNIDWDFYLSVSARYRFELHFRSPQISIGPVIGTKLKIAQLDPFDRFISNPKEVKSLLFLGGLAFGFPLGKSRLTVELVLMFRGAQHILASSAGIHFYY